VSVSHACDFSTGLADMPRRKQRYAEEVLRVLHRHGRFSVFEATANDVIARTMDDVIRRKLVEVDNSPGYPWSNVKLTDAGLALIGEKP